MLLSTSRGIGSHMVRANKFAQVPIKSQIIATYLKGFSKNKNGAFLFGISFFVLEILTFLYYAN